MVIDLQFWAFLKLVKPLSRVPFKEAIGRRAGVAMVMVDMVIRVRFFGGYEEESL